MIVCLLAVTGYMQPTQLESLLKLSSAFVERLEVTQLLPPQQQLVAVDEEDGEG